MANIDFTDVETTRAGCSGGTFPPSEISKIIRGWNSRLKLQRIEELAHEIARDGQISLVDIRKGEGGRPELVSGNRRTAAVEHINEHIGEFMRLYPRLKGPIGLKFQFVSINERDARLRNVKENTKRLELSPVDKAHVVADFREMGYKDQEIADSLGITAKNPKQQLDDLEALLALDQETQDALHAGEITRSLVKDLDGVPEKEKKEIIKEVKKGKKKSSQASREVKAKKREKGQKIGLSLKEFLDELSGPAHDPETGEEITDEGNEVLSLADALNLANDLQAHLLGQSAWPGGLEEMLRTYDIPTPEDEAEAGEYVMSGGAAVRTGSGGSKPNGQQSDDLSNLIAGARSLIHLLRQDDIDYAAVGDSADMLELFVDEVDKDREVAHALAAALNGAAKPSRVKMPAQAEE